MRKCKRCGEEKALAMFTTCRGRPTFACRACSVEKAREWVADNRERYDARCRILRAENALGREVDRPKTVSRKKGAIEVEDISPLILLERDDGVCGICGEDVDPFKCEVDHIVAVLDGGPHTYENTQIAHRSCNARKGIGERYARYAHG